MIRTALFGMKLPKNVYMKFYVNYIRRESAKLSLFSFRLAANYRRGQFLCYFFNNPIFSIRQVAQMSYPTKS